MSSSASLPTPSINDYGFLSDCVSAALVSRDGCVDWWCLPRFDAPSVFARILDDDGGHWSISPTADYTTTRDYVGESLVLRTEFTTASGSVAVTDALALRPGARGHDVGMDSPRALLRTVEGLSGSVEVQCQLAPRLEYALTIPRWTSRESAWQLRAGPVGLRLSTSVPLKAGEGDLRGRFQVEAGQRVGFCLAYRPPYDEEVDPLELEPWPATQDAVEAWESWAAEHPDYQGRSRHLVRRSALVLQGLTYQKTGAVIAAATTSLPEELGGSLNWDYRFTWLRDVSLTLQALWVAACPHEAARFFDWLAGALGELGDRPMQIMYGVEGERDLSEHTLDHLSGYRGSRPVRIGNDAWRQRQLDVLGEVLFAAHLLRDQVGELDEDVQQMLVALADQTVRDWREPDAGMWESRDEPRQYTSSKVMCWVALDCAVKLLDRLGPGADEHAWVKARDEIHETVLQEAWSEEAGAYAGAFGSDRLDASVLLMPLVGFLPADDPRMLATVEAIRDRLTVGDLVLRWEGDTAGFLICSFWLVQCLAMAGRVDDASERFDRLLGYGNDLGLFAEEAHLETGELLGNFPQAFSHVGLVNAAWRLTQASEKAGEADRR